MFSRARTFLVALVFATTPFVSLSVSAAVSDFHYEAQITDIEIVNDGTYNAIYVRGAFNPALPCPVQGFFLISTDPFQKEAMAIFLTAKSTGRPISFVHVYCMVGGAANGYSRGNGYVLK